MDERERLIDEYRKKVKEHENVNAAYVPILFYFYYFYFGQC